MFIAETIYCRVETGHRDLYSLEARRNRQDVVKSLPRPETKKFLLECGKSVTVPYLMRKEPAYNAVATSPTSGAHIEPTGDAMMAAVGPGVYSNREDVPEMTWHGKPLIQPLRVVSEYTVASQDVDPRGLPVMAGDGKQGGTVKDIWIDSAEMMFRYLEVEIAGGKSVLLPVMFSRIRRNQVEVNSIYAHHFAAVPTLKNPDQITKLEEEKISAYYGGGTFYADAKRSEPLI